MAGGINCLVSLSSISLQALDCFAQHSFSLNRNYSIFSNLSECVEMPTARINFYDIISCLIHWVANAPFNWMPLSIVCHSSIVVCITIRFRCSWRKMICDSYRIWREKWIQDLKNWSESRLLYQMAQKNDWNWFNYLIVPRTNEAHHRSVPPMLCKKYEKKYVKLCVFSFSVSVRWSDGVRPTQSTWYTEWMMRRYS